MRRLFQLVLPLGMVPVVASAQVAIGLGGVYAAPTGSDFQGTNAGPGVQGSLRLPLGPNFSFSLSGQWTSHGESGLAENWSVVGFGTEPRYTFTTHSSVQPYVSGSIFYLHESLALTAADAQALGFNSVSFTTHGFAFGAGGGVLLAAGRQVAVDLAATYGPANLSDLTVHADGLSASSPGTSLSGGALFIRAGLLIRLQ